MEVLPYSARAQASPSLQGAEEANLTTPILRSIIEMAVWGEDSGNKVPKVLSKVSQLCFPQESRDFFLKSMVLQNVKTSRKIYNIILETFVFTWGSRSILKYFL